MLLPSLLTLAEIEATAANSATTAVTITTAATKTRHPDGVDVGPKTLYARLCVAAGNSKLFNDINGFGGRGVLSTALIILTKSRGGI